ncbi:hypothetical protein [Actinoplanes sp. NPDC051851]|uniref:hypothetical protein n=1 Tax=Actinoplanes sp. NPDC051851 TaxID=3154753 RepID=UPI00344379F7
MGAHRLLTAMAAMVMLAACSGTDGGSEKADATPSSWPQPVGGRLTTEMCDLLTADDFADAGVIALQWADRTAAEPTEPSGLTCHALGGHWLNLMLQPDPDSADLYYDYLLAQHEQRAEASDPQDGGVTGADESWFDVSETGELGGHDLWARRGALLVGLNVGFLHDDGGFDPRAAAATLVAKLLSRIPDAGATGTGEPHELVLTVKGSGLSKARVMYYEPVSGEKHEEVVALPWEYRARFPWYGSRGQLITLLASPATTPTKLPLPTLTCTATVDGEQVATAGPISVVTCQTTFKDGS